MTDGALAKQEPVGGTTAAALVAICVGVFVVANDFTGLSVAIPRIEEDLGTDITAAQWVLNAYSLVFGVLIVTAGRLADIFGRKRLFLIGATIFAGFAFLSGIAPSIEFLIAARGAMGVGGALMWPALLGMCYALLPGRAGLAGGLLLGVAGLGNAVGPVLGGALTDGLDWRWVFLFNLPVTAVAMVVIARRVAETRDPAARREIDAAGIAAMSLAIVSLLLALDQAGSEGYGSAPIVALFAVSLASLAAFVAVERRRGETALIPPDVVRSRVFTGAVGAALLLSAIFSGTLVYLPQFFIKMLDYSAIGAGAGLLPMMGTFALVSFAAGPLYDGLGRRLILCLGCVFLGGGVLLLSTFDGGGASYDSVLPGMIVQGIGMGLFYPSVTTAAVTALAAGRASLASGLVYMAQVAGGAIGLGINTAIVATGDSLIDGIADAFRVDAALAVGALVLCLVTQGRGRE